MNIITKRMITQENALKFLRHRPAISVSAVEKQATIPAGTGSHLNLGQTSFTTGHTG